MHIGNYLLAGVLVMMGVSVAWAVEPPPSSSVQGIKNGDFTANAAGEDPSAWFVPTPGYGAKVVVDERAPSKVAAELSPARQGNGGMGNLMQSFEAAPFRGKRIIVRADVRLPNPKALTDPAMRDQRAQLWVRVDRAGEKTGFFDNMVDRPIRGLRAREYQTYMISGVVEDDAALINVGVMAMGGATVRVASVRVDAADPKEVADRPAAALTERGKVNLIAFTKLYGYVRFFHPSDEAAGGGVNWNEFPIAAVEHVEGAADAGELADRLGDVFRGIAPTVEIWEGSNAQAPARAPKPDGAVKYFAWRHNGLGWVDSEMTPYRSARVCSEVDKPKDDLPAPGTAVVKELGGGVCCRVPVTVWADGDGHSLPIAKTSAVPLRPERPEWWIPSGKDRATRLGDVVIAWNVFEHFYPYFEEVKTDWAPVLGRSLERAATDADEQAFAWTLRRLVAELHDGHGNVYCFNFARPLPVDAVFEWAIDENRDLALVVVELGSSGGDLRRGDRVLAIEGKTPDALYEDAKASISAATDQWARRIFLTSAEFTSPGNGEVVKYSIDRGGKRLEVSAARVKDAMQLVKEKRPANGAELAPGVVYFDLNGAQNEALEAVMPKLEKAKGIVFDARGYPGSAGTTSLQHLTDKNIKSARWNIPLVTLPDRDAAGFVMKASGRWDLPPLAPRLGAEGQKVAFVTGGGAISYAESCMGIVEHYKLGAIVGGPTAGTNGNVNPFTLPGGYSVMWTGMKVLKHDKSQHHGVGIQPTIPVQRTVVGVAAGRDEVLEAAVKAVSE